MKKINSVVSLLALLVFVSPAFAARNLSCTLSGAGSQSTISQIVPAPNEDYVISDLVGDLILNMTNSCEKDKCTGYLTIDSSLVQDEVGSTAFEFSKKAEGHVYAENITNTPDKKSYKLSCAVK